MDMIATEQFNIDLFTVVDYCIIAVACYAAFMVILKLGQALMDYNGPSKDG